MRFGGRVVASITLVVSLLMAAYLIASAGRYSLVQECGTDKMGEAIIACVVLDTWTGKLSIRTLTGEAIRQQAREQGVLFERGGDALPEGDP